MNIIIDRPQLVRVVLLYLNNNFGNLTPKKHKDYPNTVFYVDDNNEVLMDYDKKNGYIFIHYDQIWSKLESLFHLDYYDIESIMKVWLEEDYKLGNLKLGGGYTLASTGWKRITNWVI